MKKIIISLVIIGVVAGITLGITGAWWTDQGVSSNQSFVSGNLNLRLSNNGSSWGDNVSNTWNVDKMAPGGTPYESTLYMKNIGSINADYLKFTLANSPSIPYMDRVMRITQLDYAGESLLTGGAGADLSDYSSPSNPDVTVNTTSELEDAVSNGIDETVLVEPGTYLPTWGGGYMHGLKIEDADTVVARNAPDSANPSVIEGGFQIDTVDGVIVKGFKVNGGMSLWVSSCEVSSNIISTNGVGIGLFGSNNLVRNNQISGSGDPEDAGIHIQASGNTVEYNTIEGFTAGESQYYNHGKKGAGIVVWTLTDDTTIENNMIKDNTIGVMASGPDRTGVTSPTNVVVNTNNIEGNSDYGVLNMKCPGSGDYDYWEYEKYSPADSTVDATNNWWGDFDPSDQVTGNVDYIPYAGGPFIGYINGNDYNGNDFADLDDFEHSTIVVGNPDLLPDSGSYHTLKMGVQLDGPTTGNTFKNGTVGMDMTVTMGQGPAQ